MVAIQGRLVAVAMCFASAVAVAGEQAGAIRADDGRQLVFEQGVAVGAGKPAMLLRDAQGRIVREVDLRVFLPAAYIHALPRDEARLHWLREARLVGQGRVEFTVPTPGSAAGASGPALHFSIDLRDGSVRTAQIRNYLAALDEARAMEAATTLARR